MLNDRVEMPANAEQTTRLAALAPEQLGASELAGEKIEHVLVEAPGNGAAIGGIKVIAKRGRYPCIQTFSDGSSRIQIRMNIVSGVP